MNTDTERLTILSFFAHPDDETMFLGGTLAFLAARGAVVHYISATRGEGGEMGDPPVCLRPELGQVREGELRCAVQALGGASLEFLNYKDPEIGPAGELYPFSPELAPVAAALARVIDRLQPDLILTHGPGGEYGHPAHIQSHQALRKALEAGNHSPRAVYSPSWLSRETGQFRPEPDIVVDVFPVLAQKIAAVHCHRSQHGLFLRHGATRAGRRVTIPELVRSQEALCRLLPQGDGPDPLQEALAPITVFDGTAA